MLNIKEVLPQSRCTVYYKFIAKITAKFDASIDVCVYCKLGVGFKVSLLQIRHVFFTYHLL